MLIPHECVQRSVGIVAFVAAFAFATAGAVGTAVALTAEGACPNEALRQELRSGQLPDCRAYEMVSPAFKDGANAEILDVAGDGAHVVARAFGAFAGTEGEQSNLLGGPAYEFSRTPSGWVTRPLAPPPSRFPALIFDGGASRDLTRTLWMLREPSQSLKAGDLYVREPDGRFVKVGPLVPPSWGEGTPGGSNSELLAGPAKPAYVGASTDLSRVLVSLKPGENTGLLWPGDTTLGGQNSLYEYATTGLARPELVGVNDEGKQISDCGTQLGGNREAEGYNAVSSNGERVFFTALAGGCQEAIKKEIGHGPPVNELYVRIGRSETVDISEPAVPLQCEECLTTARQPAEFQGASEDGAKVFFTTKQELLKGQVTENLYEFDFARGVGHRIVLASKGSANPEVQGVARVSEDGSHAYFVAEGVLTGANREGSSPSSAPKAHNLYLFERDSSYPQGRVMFIATLSEADSADWQTSDARPVQATPDGRFLVFDSGSQVFEYDAKEELLVDASMGHAASIVGPSFGEEHGARPTAAQSELAVSSDGSYVLLVGETGLSEYHSVGSIANGNVYPIAGADGRSGRPSIDASGADVFFQSLNSLVPPDTNSGEDAYDARVNGGFPEPAGPVACEGEACHGTRSSVPLFGSPGSSSATGGGNLTPAAESKPIGKPPVKPLTQAQKLANALKACRSKQNKRKRSSCEAQARKRYSSSKAKKSNPRGKR